MLHVVLCANEMNMNTFLRRIPPNRLVLAIYLAVVGFAFLCWKGLL